MGMKEARVVMVTLWFVVGFLAILPLMHIDYFHNFYGRSGTMLNLRKALISGGSALGEIFKTGCKLWGSTVEEGARTMSPTYLLL